MEGNYKSLIEFISESSGVPVEEIERKIEAKRAKLAGLISKEGAAQVIAAELNVSFDKQLIKLSQIVPGMRKINIVGQIINLFPVREYSKNGRSGRVASFVLADETTNVRAVLWDENHIDLIAKGQINEKTVVEITNASVRNGEIHLSSFSEIKISDKNIKNLVLEKPIFEKFIVNFNSNDKVSTRAFIIRLFEPKFFEVCPECKKKINEVGECQTHGKVIPEKRALLSFVLDDGTDSIRAVMFAENLEKLINLSELENQEAFSLKKKDLLGKEMMATGQVRKNAMFNRNEFIVEDLKDVDVDELIVKLEK